MDDSHISQAFGKAPVTSLTRALAAGRNARRAGLALLVLVLCLGGCARNQDNRAFLSNSAPAAPSELFQTHSDRLATIGMRNNLNSLYRLMAKLYQRNPREWRKSGLGDREAAQRAVQQAVEQGRPLPSLAGRQDIAALSYALSPEFQGDRVGAFIYAIGSMLVTAHGGSTQFYITDTIDAQFVHNAARNIETATWLLATRRDAQGNPLLLSNELSEQGRNLSFAVEFGKIVARLDYLSDVLDERYRRIGVNYAHSLMFLNFLPVQ
ncbi:hypothetical protein SAMN05216588_13424 [Pseudomonas flavescens]|uniref:Uncharacterized protein n=1 Tax=Phytopseudomonas flavescens TaxID=29435 RepID=A0A1G8QCE0_9GAMM|nr:hypothetical protein [Pseudomonas flavescens]SDJ02125.1 hypothetical protein SAMN05216588_13424 [Pseudomonas flavescens]